jgi:hypothetical protein
MAAVIAAVLCPHPPLLLRELTGQADPAAELRAACVAALAAVLTPEVQRVHLVGAVDPRGPWSPGGASLAVTVGQRLLDLAGWTGDRAVHELDAEEPRWAAEPRSVVLFLGDGSARRGEKAPGHFDERAADFDGRILEALKGGRSDVLEGLDPALGAELLAAGVPALRCLGALAEVVGITHTEVTYADDPFGVSYWVATWRLGRG